MGSDVSPSVCLSPIERRASRILSVPPVSWGPLTHTRVNSVYHRHRDRPVVDGGGVWVEWDGRGVWGSWMQTVTFRMGKQ